MKTRMKLLLCSLIATTLSQQGIPGVQLEQGNVVGRVSDDGSYSEFIGIPYATLDSSTRFRAPLPAPTWQGVYNATVEYYCPQPTDEYGTIETEDCLKVNVYVPTTSGENLPVMIYIHGGGFETGSGGKLIYGPEFLIKQGVILVTFNYRLGALGFLCLGIEEAPGNAGLRDQIAALKWVKKNIAAFNGDPDNVTIFGGSGGAISVSLLLVSEAADGLFNRAISLSGTGLTYFTVSMNPIERAITLTKALGYDTEDPHEIYEILSRMPYRDIINANMTEPQDNYFDSVVSYSPCVEKPIPGVEPVISDLPYNLLTKKSINVPVIYGSTSREGLVAIAGILTEEAYDEINDRYLFGADLEFPSEIEAANVDEKLKRFYFGDDRISYENRMNLSDVYTHLAFEVPAILETEILLQTSNASVYNYVFDYSGGRNFVKFSMGFANEPGATHGDEYFYLFNPSFASHFPIDEEDQKVIDWMTKMWTNFAKYGDPTPPTATDLPVRWMPSTRDSLTFLHIEDDLRMGPMPNPEAYELWSDVYDKYRRTNAFPHPSTPEVELEQGTVSGVVSGDGTFWEYIGIPYGTVNKSNRFQAPHPAPTWEGVYQATVQYYCPQSTPGFGAVETEDCLKLNVHVPAAAQKPLPVMVHIHGGGFDSGSSGRTLGGPEFIVKQDVILVTVNYRLGVLGYLCLGIEEAPGNVASRDHIAALKWVKKNIAAFGGDPESVTVFGESAGGISVSILLASEAADGLFNRAIVQSGTALSYFVATMDPLERAITLAKALGQDIEDPHELYELFSNMPYRDLIDADMTKPNNSYFDSITLYSPCIEKSIPGIEPVINDFPYNLFSKNPKNIPVMYGSTDREGLSFISHINQVTEESLEQLNERYLFGADLEFSSNREAANVDEKLKQFYFGNERISFETRMKLSDVYTHLAFEMPAILETELILRNRTAPVYNYIFSYSGGRNFMKFHAGFANETGANHADDNFYLFNATFAAQFAPENEDPFAINDEDQKIIDWMTKLWTNFAKYGDPTPPTATDLPVRWMPSTSESLTFLHIEDELRMGPMPNPEAYELWSDVYEKHRRTNAFPHPSTPEVELEQGTVSGVVRGDGTFWEYIGIPYGTVNDSNRFQAPHPAPTWEGVYQATVQYYCPQSTPGFGAVETEDCLKLNVHVPAAAQKPLPVMVHIHGGGFDSGSSGRTLGGPEFIVKQDVILVTVNYRLGVLGYLCLGIEEAPGNVASRDHIAALKWVKKNIAAFGGDPESVTVFGESAGGISVSILLASEAADGLFNRAIVQSGTALSYFVATMDPLERAITLAKALGQDIEDPHELYELFSNMPYRDLIDADMTKPNNSYFDSITLYSPCIEKSIPGIEPVINDFPYNLFSKNPKNIPVMYGSTDREGLSFISHINQVTEESLEQLNERYLFGADLEFSSNREAANVDEKLKQFYFGNERISFETRMKLSDVYTHLAFEMPAILETELILRNRTAPVYNYIFSYSGGRNFMKFHAGFANETGANHADDNFYLFNATFAAQFAPENEDPFAINDEDQKIIDWMTKLWTNFAKYGDPTPPTATDLPVRWMPSTKDSLTFLHIEDELRMGPMPNPEAYELWSDVYEKHRRTTSSSSAISGSIALCLGLIWTSVKIFIN